ncbi:hypothetical protein CN572_19395 [Bacillus wiedmannii]|uniref:hypothetical protein n=1 Tax=Bacillus wiedmannii TaxID=1890302 RepID=UPI000BEFD80A|nr:hypothetical protein [Bacillus wiedmannii]PEI77417.1 hypothetical protein CN905_15490 [Bacillus wiedmannii]PEO71176.1 hypothetical protein CN572_19395 [Bacillus wiedmannii]PHE75213.1 hypothetical protein COF47_17585 [Bacillus wiedmannii]
MDLGANKDIQVLQMTNQILATENAKLQYENAVLQARLVIAEGEVQHANGNDANRSSEHEHDKDNKLKGE